MSTQSLVSNNNSLEEEKTSERPVDVDNCLEFSNLKYKTMDAEYEADK